MPLLDTLEASDRDSCPSLRRFGCHYQDNSDENMPDDCKFKQGRSWSIFQIINRLLNPAPSSSHATSNKSEELDGLDVSPRSQPSFASALQPPQSPFIAIPSLDSAISHTEITQSHIVEDI